MHYYKRNLGDYAKKAGRLSMLQHGAYTLLIDACYDREQFPTLEEAMDWTWASSTAEREAVEFVLGKFFTLEDGRYVQKRIKEELEAYKEVSETNARIARDRETKRAASSTKRARVEHDSPRSKHEAPPNQEPLTTNQEPIQSPPPSAPPPAIAVVKPAKGSRLPSDWTPDTEGLALAASFGFANGRAQLELERFRDYWTAQPGAKGLKLDWPATWRNWLRSAAERAQNARPAARAQDVEPEWRRRERERNEAFLGPAAIRRTDPNTIEAQIRDITPDLLTGS